MPRPSSKVLTDKNGPDLAPEDAKVKLQLVKPEKPARGPKPIPVMSKAETKAQVTSFKEALKKAREPLTEREGNLAAATKALAVHDKEAEALVTAYTKAQAALEKAHAKEVAAKDKARKALLKAEEAAKFSVDKAAAQFAKGESKINAQIAALSPAKE